jgi:hypothetical protein
MFRAASLAQHSLPLLHAAVIPGLVFTTESPAYLSKFRNLDRVSHPQKIARPPRQDQITVVVERLGPVPGKAFTQPRDPAPPSNPFVTTNGRACSELAE